MTRMRRGVILLAIFLVSLLGLSSMAYAGFQPRSNVLSIAANMASLPDHQRGVFRGAVTFRVTKTVLETLGIDMRVSNLGATGSVAMTSLPVPDAGSSSVEADPPRVLADGVSASTLTVTVVDESGGPIAGLLEEDFAFTGVGSATVVASDISLAVIGVYSFQVTNTVPEMVTIVVSVGGVDVGSATITFLPVPDAGIVERVGRPDACACGRGVGVDLDGDGGW